MEIISSNEEGDVIVHRKRTNIQIFTAISKTLLLDVLQLLLFSFPIIVFYAWRQQIGFKTGFFCDDSSIRYPYVQSKISQGNIAAQTLLGPPIILTLSEIIKRFRIRCDDNNIGKVIYLRIIRYFHGFFICMSFTYVPKLFRGNLRPHFMAVCKPKIDCTATYNQLRLIEDYECMNDNVSIDVYMSFPSVHTSAAVFVSVYLIFYIWKRIKWTKLRICLQFFVLLYAYTISLSRVAEHYHHPSDVIAGTIIGGLSAYASVKYLEDFFRNPGVQKTIHKAI